MTDSKFMSFLEFAKGFYKQGLDMIDPKNDDFTILSGCLLLVIGLEKLLKHALEAINPLLTLEDIKHTDVLDLQKGKQFNRKQVICLNAAFIRLNEMHPVLGQEQTHFDVIRKERDFLIHQAGYFDIIKIENRVRLNLANISESICVECLGTTPENVFGKDLWDRVAGYRETHLLELQKRVDCFKRLHSQHQQLPCKAISVYDHAVTYDCDCPICGKTAELIMDVDIYGSSYFDGLYVDALNCDSCGFTMDEHDEIRILLGDDYILELIHAPLNHDFIQDS